MLLTCFHKCKFQRVEDELFSPGILIKMFGQTCWGLKSEAKSTFTLLSHGIYMPPRSSNYIMPYMDGSNMMWQYNGCGAGQNAIQPKMFDIPMTMSGYQSYQEYPGHTALRFDRCSFHSICFFIVFLSFHLRLFTVFTAGEAPAGGA